jgi:hypothetical protein
MQETAEQKETEIVYIALLITYGVEESNGDWLRTSLSGSCKCRYDSQFFKGNECALFVDAISLDTEN